MVRFKIHQKMPAFILNFLSFCLFDFLSFWLFCPFVFYYSPMSSFEMFLYLFALFVPSFLPFLGFVSSTSSKCLKYLNFAQYVWYDQCNVSCSISPDVSAYFMILRKRETERERNRVGGSIGSSEQLWPFPAQSQLSTTIPTFSSQNQVKLNSQDRCAFDTVC